MYVLLCKIAFYRATFSTFLFFIPLANYIKICQKSLPFVVVKYDEIDR